MNAENLFCHGRLLKLSGRQALWLAILGATIVSSIIPAQAQDATAATARTSKPLQGGIEHDERLPAVSPQFNIGATIDPTALMSETPNNEWFQIPDWFAGTWHADEQTRLSAHDFESEQTDNTPMKIKESSSTVYGTQRDKKGQIWNYIKVPRTEKQVLAHGAIAYDQATREDALQSDSTQVILKYLYDQLTVSKKDQIESVIQIQAINTYSPLQDGLVRMRASMKSFDADGEPHILQIGEKILKRTAPFQVVDKDGDLDLKKLFVEYLTKTGRQDLIPTDG